MLQVFHIIFNVHFLSLPYPAMAAAHTQILEPIMDVESERTQRVPGGGHRWDQQEEWCDPRQ